MSSAPHRLFAWLEQVHQIPPASLALFLDVDGTLVPIADRPDDVRISTRVHDLLQHLAKRVKVLALVSGRTTEVLQEMIPLDGIVYVGNHGLERVPAWPKPWQGIETGLSRRTAERILQRVRIDGLLLEAKGPAATIHYRLAAHPEEARQRLLAALAPAVAAGNVKLLEGRSVIELRPVRDSSKGQAVAAMLDEYAPKSALYIGDDLTDISAFRAIHKWRDSGRLGLAIAVTSSESRPELIAAADTTVGGPDEVARLLRTVLHGGEVPR